MARNSTGNSPANNVPEDAKPQSNMPHPDTGASPVTGATVIQAQSQVSNGQSQTQNQVVQVPGKVGGNSTKGSGKGSNSTKSSKGAFGTILSTMLGTMLMNLKF